MVLGSNDNSLGKLIVEIGANLDDLSKGLDSAKRKVSDAEKDFNRFSANTKISIGNIAGIFAGLGAAAVTGIGLAINSTVRYNDEILTLSKRTGISTESLSRLKFVAEQTNSSLEALATGIKFLNKNMFEASNGSKEMMASFGNINVNIKNVDGSLRNVEDVFLDIADKISVMTNQSEKAGLAMEFFGRNGTSLLPVLELGSKGIKELSDRAEKLGVVLTADNAVKIGEFDDKLKELKTAIGGAALQIGTALIPALTNLVNFITEKVLPIVDGMNAAFVETGKVVSAKRINEALGSDNPEIDAARKELVDISSRRDILQSRRASGVIGGEVVSDQINILLAKEQALRQFIVEKMEEQRVKIQEIRAEQEISSQQDVSGQVEEGKLTRLKALQEEISLMKDEELKVEIQRINDIELLASTSEQQKTEIIREEIQKRTRAQEENEKVQRDIEQRRKELLSNSLSDSISALQVLARHNKAAAIAFKVIETGKTIIAGARAFAEALPNFGLAALVAAATAAKVAVINSVEFEEGSADVPNSGGVTHPGEIVVPKTFADSIRSGDLTLGGDNKSGNISPNQTIIERIEVVVNGNLDEESAPSIIEQLGLEIESKLRGAL